MKRISALLVKSNVAFLALAITFPVTDIAASLCFTAG